VRQLLIDIKEVRVSGQALEDVFFFEKTSGCFKRNFRGVVRHFLLVFTVEDVPEP
jgi:hypothetical protein